MKKFFPVFFFFLQHTSFCQPPGNPAYFQQQVNYKIDVTLNDASNTLDGAIKLEYINNSPDTLYYIWFHLWPNAYKNDKTDFSDQLLQNGRTDFYFSDNDRRGYINRLEFKVNGITARLEDHPQYFDVAKLILPLPLAPGQTINISTPFHEKIPFNFSRGGHVGQTYQITQWYPKPAVYDNAGWHPIPYLDQGEFYSEFGNYDVQVTLPKNYIVAATGELQNDDEKKWLAERSKLKLPPIPEREKTSKISHTTIDDAVRSSKETKTLRYLQSNVHDFAWFADKNFIVRTDTIQLQSGRIIDAWSFFTPSGAPVWKNSIQFIKDAVRTRSKWLGEYPYQVVTALEARMGFDGGMEYPTITSISPVSSEKDLDLTIEHEVGHNWNYGILGSNERLHPWMDEGMNTYFDNRYIEMKYPGQSLADMYVKSGFLRSRLPQDVMDWLYRTLLKKKSDQPIETPSEKFSEVNYNMIAYYKTGRWMKVLQDYVGSDVFDSCLHEYYQRWKFKHPQPADFKKVVEDVSGKNVDSIFNLLDKKGPLQNEKMHKTIQVVPLFSFKETTKRNYIFVSPSIGINYYDKLMVGGLLHNYTIPANRFQFFLAPMYATGSKKMTGLGRIGYNWSSYGLIHKSEISLSGATFSSNVFTDSAGNKKYLGFNKIVPSLKITFKERDPRSTFTKWLQWKTFFIQEDGILFARDTVNQVDVITYPKSSRYLNQLRFVIENNRVLYPYNGELMAEQGVGFIKTSFTGNYFFNFPAKGGVAVRLFAGKFTYLGDKTLTKQFATDRYHINMTGANGYEDYTYSNYFIGRNEFEKISSQQIMIKDGGFKVRTDLLASKIGKTDDWLAALNFKTDIPEKLNPLQVLPLKIPIKLFFDVGTYAEAWKKDPATGRFIFDGGLQVSLIKDLLNIYIPIIYSKVYADYFKSTLGEKRFWKNISFSIDLQNFSLRKILPQAPL